MASTKIKMTVSGKHTKNNPLSSSNIYNKNTHTHTHPQRSSHIDSLRSRPISSPSTQFVVKRIVSAKRWRTATGRSHQTHWGVCQQSRRTDAGRIEQRHCHHWLWIVATGVSAKFRFTAAVQRSVDKIGARRTLAVAKETRRGRSRTTVRDVCANVYGDDNRDGQTVATECKVGLLWVAVVLQ